MGCDSLVRLRPTIQKITLNPEKYSIAPRDIDQIRSIEELINVLQEFADYFQEEADSLTERIREVANEAEDVLEHLIPKQSRSRIGLNKYICFLPKFRREAKFQLQHEKITVVYDSIAGVLMDMKHIVRNKRQFSYAPAENSSAVIPLTSNTSEVVGLDADSVGIKIRLCGESPKLQVIPIVGMGGIGKTTLCTNVYNDPLTVQYFDIRAWVTFSKDYSMQNIVSSLINSVKEFSMEKSEQSDEATVYKSLKGRRYLIVVDDMWSTNAWDDLRDLFPNDNNGSRIMLTTRLCDVAAYIANGSPLHEMRFMGIQQSWELLRQRVFADQECSPELENIGKKIAESCRGLPLAIVVIAGILSMAERNSMSWFRIANNVSSIAVTEDSQIAEILSLSFTHLPDYLRPCFLYMGAFPEDHEICVSELARLWVAEGLLRCAEGSSKCFEEEAEEVLEDLVNRSLVLVTKRKYNGRIKSCSLHDLIRDLSIRKARESNFFGVLWIDMWKRHYRDSMKVQNRVSVKSSSLKYLPSICCPTIRTIMCFPFSNRVKRSPIKLNFLESVGLLRVLNAEDFGVQSHPDELFKLFELRYLAIRSFTIPAAISRLQNLQTLVLDARNQRKITGRPIVGCLPQEIWMMPQLRHLICHSKLPSPKKNTSALDNLQRLSVVSNDMCFDGILEKIPNIKRLGIDCSYYDSGTQLNNLVYLQQLVSLELRNAVWRKDSICFPVMLRKLTLYDMSLPWSEMSVIGSLPNLEVLKLRDFACIGSTWETSEGEFPQLQFLLIDTSKLVDWIAERSHFPRLRFLVLHDCWYLNEIPEGIGEYTTLELIEVRGHARPVPKSLAESCKKIKEEQQDLGNDGLQVHCPRPESCVPYEWLLHKETAAEASTSWLDVRWGKNGLF